MLLDRKCRNVRGGVWQIAYVYDGQYCSDAQGGKESCAGNGESPLEIHDTSNESARYLMMGSYGMEKCGTVD